MEIENWKPVVGYEGRYEVSDLGRVKSLLKSRMKRRLGDLRSPCMGNKYLHVGLTDQNGKTKTILLHRIVAEAFHGLPQNGMECCHIDGDRMNCSASNLMWGSRALNHHHKIAHGTHVEGENVHRAVLDRSNVFYIDWLLANGRTQGHVAEIFGVSQFCISAVSLRKTWKFVPKLSVSELKQMVLGESPVEFFSDLSKKLCPT